MDLLALATIFCLAITTQARAVTFTETFDTGILDSRLAAFSTGPGFSLTLSGGKALVAKDAGVGNGVVGLNTSVQLVGDFTATVQTDRALGLGSGEIGLAVNSGNIFFSGPGEIHTALPPIGFINMSTLSSPVTFRIRRTGDTILEEFDAGTGFSTVISGSDPSFGAPTTAMLFLTQAFGNTEADVGAFDDFTVVVRLFRVSASPFQNLPRSL